MLNPGNHFTSNPSLQALNYTTPSTQPDLQFCLAKICFYSKYCPSANIAVEDGQSQTDTLRHFKFQTFHPAWLDSTGSEQLHGNCMECPSALSECREPTLTHQMSISVIFMIFVTNCSTWLKLQWAMGTNKVETLMIYRSCKINTYNYTTFRSIRNQVARPKACHTGSFCKGYKDGPALSSLPCADAAASKSSSLSSFLRFGFVGRGPMYLRDDDNLPNPWLHHFLWLSLAHVLRSSPLIYNDL